jgi:signal transduction histidine kinase
VAFYSRGFEDVQATVAFVRNRVLIATAGALLIALIGGLLIATRLGRRVGRLERAARAVARGRYGEPLPVTSKDEIGRLTETFNQMQQQLQRVDIARKEFIATASHELRTPIFSLGGFVELLDEDEPDPEARAEFVRTMRQQVERLTKLTTDLLDLSKLDAGALEVATGNVELAALAREVAREFGPVADHRGSRLEVRTPAEPAVALADPDRVRQIIRILLDNALTHTPEGTKVTVTTYNSNSRAELTVSDEGLGIPKRIRERMFDRFFTGDSVSGSGLGLAIARELALRMGGGIAVTSTKGFTAFTLDLPQAAPLAPAATASEAPA